MKRKRFLFCLLFMMTAGISFGQETISLNVVYEFRYVRDLAQKDNPFVSSMVLSVGKGTSRFCTDKQYKDNAKIRLAMKRQLQPQMQAMPSAKATVAVSGGLALLVDRSGVAIREEIMKDIPGQKLETIGFIGTRVFTVETALPKINWALKPEKRVFGKYTCQRALGNYAGRVYEAWFTADLPLHDGPWKLTGLPGLILEARDTANEVVFTFKGISGNEDPEETVVSYLKGQSDINTSLTNYNRAMAAFETDPEAIMLAEFPNATVHIACIDTSGTRKVVKIKKFNPVEKN